jgi:hypothetical protein
VADDVTVRVGQVWADLDKRSKGRRIRVLEVGQYHATVRDADAVPGAWPPARKTRIRLDRFRPTSTGYRLVSEPDQHEGGHA